MLANSETGSTSLRRRNMKETFANRPALLVIGVLFLLQFLAGCDYARMKDDEAIQTYDAAMPKMPATAVPFGDSYQRSMGADPKCLKNPLSYTTETVQLGMEKYGYYCVQCHGPTGKGNGTVGQSFAPLPADLQGPHVQQQTDGEIFHRTSVGYKRHPPMAYTVAERDRWAIVIYIRSLVTPAGKGS